MKIAVVYHSAFGHTEVVARCVASGAEGVPGAQVHLLSVADFPAPVRGGAAGEPWTLLDEADCIVFGCPTYMGSVSADFKRFMDHTSGAWGQQKWRDKLAAGFTNSGAPSGDKLSTLQAISAFAGQHSMVWVSTGVPMADGLNAVGGFLGLMTTSANGPPDETPDERDRETSRRFGARVAEATARWVRGRG